MEGIDTNKLRDVVERILDFKEQQDRIGDYIKEVYLEVVQAGLDKTAIGSVISLKRKQAKDKTFVEKSEKVQAYLDALDAPSPRTHTHAPVGESISRRAKSSGPVDAKLVETIAAGMQTETGRKALVTALDIMIEREEAIDPDTGEILSSNPPKMATECASSEHGLTACADLDEAVVTTQEPGHVDRSASAQSHATSLQAEGDASEAIGRSAIEVEAPSGAGAGTSVRAGGANSNIAGEPATMNSGQMNRVPVMGPLGREECVTAQLGATTCETPSGAQTGSAVGTGALATITIPDDQLVSVRYPDGVRRVPYREFRAGVEVAKARGAAA